MPYLLVHHQVEDFAKWKVAFDEHAGMRKSAGSKGGRLFQGADDSNEVVVVFEWDTMENAHAFAESADLREAMEKAGVSGPPTLVFMEGIARLTE